MKTPARLPRHPKALGKHPGYVRYSGYDTPEDEAKFLPYLGPVWHPGDPVPGNPYVRFVGIRRRTQQADKKENDRG